VFRVLKPGGYVLAFGGTRTFHRLTCGIEDAGFEIRDCLSWLYGQGFPKSLNVGNGQGTALKPAWEPIILARKPTIGTVAANILRHSTGALNIDACRIGDDDTRRVKEGGRNQFPHEDDAWTPKTVTVGSDLGRWPANVVLDEEAAAMLDEQSGQLTSGNFPAVRHSPKTRDVYGLGFGDQCLVHRGTDSGGASRFFYTAKPSRAERGEGNDHPTVKPLALMRYLVRLVTPPGGVVLDPFMGSGTTGMACAAEGLRFVGIEREAEYVEIAERRIASIAPLFDDRAEATP
jgi:site-specific DNA-methyltransferase (adenine-specific)